MAMDMDLIHITYIRLPFGCLNRERKDKYMGKEAEEPKESQCSVVNSDDLLCSFCGGKLTEIRGRFPDNPKRKVCPTCLQETIESIRDRISPDYGKAYVED